MPRLTFVLQRETGVSLARERGCALASGPASIPGMIAHLEAGRDVVAMMQSAATGFRIPQGTEVEFHPECPETGALRHQCEGRVHRASAVPLSEKTTGRLIYVDRPRRALSLADRLDALSVVHPSDLGQIEAVLSSGRSVVMPIDLAREDFRIPRGAGIFFAQELEGDPRRARAGIHAMLCGATSVSQEDHRYLTATLTDLEEEHVAFGVVLPTVEIIEEPDPA